MTRRNASFIRWIGIAYTASVVLVTAGVGTALGIGVRSVVAAG